MHEWVESGLLLCGGDTDDQTNPFEVRLGKYIDLNVADDVIGIQALRRIQAAGPVRHQLGVRLEGDQPDPFGFSWEPVFQGGKKVGDLTNSTWFHRLKQNIGFALIAVGARPGDTVEVQRASGRVRGTLCELPFI